MKYTINAWNVHTEESKEFGPFELAPQITYDLLRNTDDGGIEIADYRPDGLHFRSTVNGAQVDSDGWVFYGKDGEPDFVATDFVIGAKP